MVLNLFSFTQLKYRDDLWSKQLMVAVAFTALCWVGTSISLAGITELPKCKYGDPRCYFFVQVCENDLFPEETRSCTYMPKQRKTEGGTEDGLDQVTIPILASCMGLLPGLALCFANVIRNERLLFSILEFGKLFLGFDLVLLTLSCLQMDRLTWDCRWWDDEHHPDSDKCEGAFSKYVIGTVFIFGTEFVLLIYAIAFCEQEKKRVTDNRSWFSTSSVGNTSTTSVQMATMGSMGTPGMGSEVP